LLKFKRQVVKETVIEDGNAIVRTRASLGDPPPVTFREGKTIDHLDTTKPQAYKPSKPIPATIKIQFTPTIIHPWYMVPIRQCLICRTIYHQTLIAESDNFDLCEACVRNWENYCKDSTKTNWRYIRGPSRALIYPKLDLDDIVESYDFPSGAFKIVFLWARYSPPGVDPPLGYYDLEFLMKFKSKRYKDTLVKVLAGSGRTYIVPDQYYKACQADSTLVSYKPYKEHPNWNNLCIDINCVLMDRAQVTANIVINRMDDLSTSPFHLRMALGEFKYPKRTFVVVRSLNRNPNRSGTCAVSDLINLLDSMADFSEISTVAGLCLKSCYEETRAPNKGKNKPRSKESDPEMELYSSQPSTQGGSQGSQPLAKSGSFSMSVIMNTIPEEGMEDITMTVENLSEFNYPRMLTLNGGFIEASSVDVVDRNSGEKIFKVGEVVQVLRFASIPESRKPKEKAKKRKRK
jgi:hypothetical protein